MISNVFGQTIHIIEFFFANTTNSHVDLFHDYLYNYVFTTCLSRMKRFISFPVVLSYTKKSEFDGLNVIAFGCRSLLARAGEAFIIHHDFTTTKGPRRTYEMTTFRIDL